MSYEHVDGGDEEDFEDNDNRLLASRSRITTIHADLAFRPSIYYEEGPFDAPSSDEGEGLIEKQDHVLSDDPNVFGDTEPGNGLLVGGNKRPASLKYLIISLTSLVFLSASIGLFAATSLYNGQTYRLPGARKISLDHIFNATFMVSRKGVDWVPEAGDGVFSVFQNGQIQLVDLKSNKTTDLVSVMDIKDDEGNVIYWTDWKLSPDMSYILVKADHLKQWRHSSFGNYYVHNLNTKVTYPLVPPTHPPVIAYATWSPTGQSIAFVAPMIYTASTSPIRVTSSGNTSLFNGVPDWIYEEEVFENDYALWWSPDSSKIAFLRLDETEVDEFRFPIYNPTEDSYAVVPYTEDVVIKYPKPGYNNPLASVHVFDVAQYERSETSPDTTAEIYTSELSWEGRFPAANSVIMDVTWVGQSTLIVKEVTRAADNGSVVYFDLTNMENEDVVNGRVVRRLGSGGEEGDNGWIQHAQSIFPLPDSLRSGDSSAYLDIVPTDGYNHIALFDPAESKTPLTGGIKAVDTQRGLIRAVINSTPHYSIPFSASVSGYVEPISLTDESIPSSYSASFSPEAGFYLLNYNGPAVPWQRIVDVGNEDFDYVLTDNSVLNATLAEFETAVVTYSTIDSDGFELNVKEMRPPRMDDSGRTKYPVLFFVYGGPESQQVNLEYIRNWHDYLVCTLQYVVVIVDGRGTGFKGRHLRNPVRNNLGFWETQDQINAARIWAGKDYVDRNSYGGFMASKIAEANAGIHTLAMAVAPVTSWRLYDSIYTERYMDLPDNNPGGYINASISHVEGFKNIDYLLAHGSGDDNVHYANTAHLLDMFTEAQVRNFRFRMFTDSDHSITRRGANREVYEYMALFLIEKWGKGGRRRNW
ncbi:dipeptidyl peptidase IV N-terminal region-domain-containing protein [Suillus spraguei]|nr:dipeptidyl peptidase IV N-terminal region-domain-containing protein [Suillus spraguei]